MIQTTEFDVPGYQLVESLSTHGKTAVYRATRLTDGGSVIIKTVNTEFPSLKLLGRLRHEFEILSALRSDELLQVQELKQFNGRQALILTDIGGTSLYHLLHTRSLKLEECLKLCIAVTRQLALVHDQGIIHKDINPSNIVYNGNTDQVQLVDFSISSRLSHESQKATATRYLEGTLAYISPEQTGRMNRLIDNRTDFYSLGVTFYQMLVGKVPFTVIDPMELVHCHIARSPEPAHVCNPAIPLPLSRITCKLMAKNAEDRYQSVYGILADLQRCWDELKEHGKIEPFSVGENDPRDSFRIHQKLYGRERELQALAETIERVSRGRNELLLIAGHSGVGKSALINEIYKPMAGYRGFLISGKFDPYQRNTPYTSLVQACRELIRQLLSESDADLAVWKNKILKQMGGTTSVVLELIPELAHITGPIPKAPTLASAETENRFHLAFRRFLALFSGRDRPLVMVFDDLQWVDLATLKLVRALITDTDIQSLLIIGTYRNEEVDEEHPVSSFMRDLEGEQVRIQKMNLEVLSHEQLTRLVADSLYCSQEKVSALSAAIYSKTSGNPFFVTEYLKSLYDDGLIGFNNELGRWNWNIKQIKRMSLTDDAVAFMAKKIRKLSSKACRILTYASCIGNRFDLELLSQINETSQSETTRQIWEALREGLIMPVDDGYTLVGGEMSRGDLEVTFEFLHDQVQQAAYSLLPTEERAQVHLAIGRLLLQDKSEDELDENVFDIVNHLNLGLDYIDHPNEVMTLVQLNTIAGRKARVAGAYEAAISFLTTGLDLLGKEAWQIYDLAMPLSMELAECHYLCGRIGVAEQRFDAALEHAQSDLEKAAIYQTRTVLYAHLGKYVEAIEVGLEGLAMFGIQIPYMDDELRGEIAQTLTSIREKMAGKQPEDLIDQPRLTDPIVYAAINQLINLWSPASNVNLNLMKLIVLKIVDLSLSHGNVDVSSYGYVGYALVLGSGFGDYHSGEAFGELGLRLNDQFRNLELKCRVYFVHGALVKPWRAHLRETTPLLSEAYEAGLESGDIMWASLCLVHMVLHRVMAGDQLRSIEAEAETCLSFLKKARYEQSIEIMRIVLRFVRALRTAHQEGTGSNHWRCATFDETGFLMRNQRKLFLVAVNHLYTCKAQLAWFERDFKLAEAACDQADRLQLFKFGWPSLAEQVLFKGLIHAELWHLSEGDKAAAHLDSLHECLEKLMKWAGECPTNFRCRYLLLAAEAARVTNHFERALDYFDEAIAWSRKWEFTHIEAMACEQAGRYLLERNKRKLARIYLQDAYFHYGRWGALGKTEQLKETFAELLNFDEDPAMTPLQSLAAATTTQDNPVVLDMTTFMKASLTISSEIQLDRLLSKLMEIVLENAGAQRGFLFLDRPEGLYLEASKSVNEEELQVLQSLPLAQCKTVPLSVVNYVYHAHEPIVLANAAKEGHFTTDPFIISHHTKSLLCLPVLHKGKLAGILYLDNNIAYGAFTPSRTEVLHMLTSEAAISIENARLYKDLAQANRTLESKVAERTRELREKNEELGDTLNQVKEMQQQIIQQEKMASLGTLSAGIAHEIRNPLNFVNNFAVISQELLDELQDEMGQVKLGTKKADVQVILDDLSKNLGKIHDHGKRADDIVHSMLMHSHRKAAAKPKETDVNGMLDKFVNLAFHSMRAKNPMNLSIIKDMDPDLAEVEAIPQDLGRVFLNLVDNAFDSMQTKKSEMGEDFQPTLSVKTRNLGNRIEIRIRDNGRGIPAAIVDDIFNPFFTTKPAGQGTGLGLSISYDIVVKEHQGKIRANSEEGVFTEFVIELPRKLYKPTPN